MRKPFLIGILLASCLFATSNPLVIESRTDQTTVHDVGWQDSEIVSFKLEANNFFELTVTLAPAEALLPVTVQYQKKKFVSFDKKRNNKEKALYGLHDRSVQEELALTTDIPINDIDFERPGWQLEAVEWQERHS